MDPLAVDMVETENIIHVWANVPGCTRANVELELHPTGILTIRAESPAIVNHIQGQVALAERPATLQRSLRVLEPHQFNDAEVQANLQDGLLQVRISRPFAQQANQAARIQVRDATEYVSA